MKLKKLLALVFCSIICTVAFGFAAACAQKTYTVTFEMNGHGVAPQAITGLTEGSTIRKPADPKAENFIFNGWYKDDSLSDEWNFATDKVTSDITLYASWADAYTVTFEMNGHGDAPQPVTGLAAGSTVDKPDDPVAENFVFNGWYKDELLTVKWNFATDTVSENLTIYAGWKGVHAVSAEAPFNVEVNDLEYFSISHAGNYTVDLTVKDGAEGETFKYLFNDLENTVILNSDSVSSTVQYFEAGTYKFTKSEKSFSASVSVQALAMPFDYEEAYMGDGYSLSVVQASAVPAVRFSSGYNPTGFVTAVAFDGELYTLKVRENGAGLHEYSVKIKINKVDEEVVSIDVYTKTDGVWGTQPTDSLVKASRASDSANHGYLAYSADGALNEAGVIKTFDYVYYCVVALKDKWFVFNDFADGTEFYWCDIYTGRTGERCDKIDIVAGEPFRLMDTGMYSDRDFIMVKPANGAKSVSFTVTQVPEPAPVPGLSADNPAILVDGEAHTIAKCNKDSRYYFTFTVPEEGKYMLRVYRVSEGNNYAVEKCELDNYMAYLPFTMPTVSALKGGTEVALKARQYNFSVVVGGGGGDLVVSVEKIVAAGIQSGTYTYTKAEGPFTLNYTFVFDAAAQTVSLRIVRILTNGGVQMGDDRSEAKELTDEGGAYSVSALLVGSSFKSYTFSFSEDGSSVLVTGDEIFTAVKQA